MADTVQDAYEAAIEKADQDFDLAKQFADNWYTGTDEQQLVKATKALALATMSAASEQRAANLMALVNTPPSYLRRVL